LIKKSVALAGAFACLTMVDRHDEILILMIVGSVLWAFGHHVLQAIFRMFRPDQAAAMGDIEGSRTVDGIWLGGSSNFKIWKFAPTLCSTQGSWEAFMGSAGFFLMTWASVLNGRRIKDSIDMDESEDNYSGWQLDLWSTVAPLAIWFGWLFPRFYGTHVKENTSMGTAFQAAIQAVGWLKWGELGAMQKTNEGRTFCFVSAAILAVLEVVMNHTSTIEAEKIWSCTVPRLITVMAYYAMWAMFIIGFCQEPGIY
jgi:hypothetical protein